MKSLAIFVVVALSALSFTSAHAAKAIIIIKNPSGGGSMKTVSLKSGTYCYAIYVRNGLGGAAGTVGTPPTTFVEVSAAVGGTCDDTNQVAPSPVKDMALEVGPTMSVVNSTIEDSRQSVSFSSVSLAVSISSMDLIADAAVHGPSSGPVLMKKGTVKFFNESKRVFVQAPGLADIKGGVFLILPDELQKFVVETRNSGSRVIVILRETPKGKKGLTAVNVKLA